MQLCIFVTFINSITRFHIFSHTGLIYLFLVILLFTFFIVRTFKSKYRLEADCDITNWIDSVITGLTLTSTMLASILLISSLTYVGEVENRSESKEMAIMNAINRTEDFIRRNSQAPSVHAGEIGINFKRNSSICSNSWLSAVRTEAYETQRRMSLAPSFISKSTMVEGGR